MDTPLNNGENVLGNANVLNANADTNSSLVKKIYNFEKQMLEGKLVMLGDNVKPMNTRGYISCNARTSLNGEPNEFVNKPVAENYKAKSSEEETKVVRKNDDAQIIEE
nr:isocitrate lyase [Tanacetum cinerariifolium]